jgi:hypothetical protein
LKTSLFIGSAVAQMNPDALDTLNNADWSDILKSQQPDETWAPSTVYKSPDLIAAVEKMTNTGIGEYTLLGGLSEAEGNYALVNLAAMLAQSMHETIQYDACDENNWDSTSGYTSANACGQLGQSYQDYQCPAGEEHMACEVDPEMELVASTNAKWYGAPGPMFCAPKSKVPKAPRWEHSKGWCDPNQDYPKLEGDAFFANVNGEGSETCGVYEGQKAGGWELCNGESCPNAAAPVFGQEARTDVEGCCWWGRGVIQTTGVCNFGKLNYFAGARAAREGRESLFPNVDFCKRPDSICNSTEHPDLKWVAGLFFYAKEVQLYPTDDAWGFDYEAELRYFTDNGNINDRAFIDKVSGIVNRGCPSLNGCAAGHTHEAGKRAQNFQTVLRAFGYPFDGTAPIVTTQSPVTTGQGNTTGQNNGGNSNAGGKCTSSCSSCKYNTSHSQSADDAACAPCANGQSFWPCNVDDLCYCADESEAPETTTQAPVTTEAVTTEAPTTQAPTTEATTTEAPTTQAPTTEATTTEAPVTTTQAPQTTTKYTTRDCTHTEPTTEKPTTQAPTTESPSGPVGGECDASCESCVAIPGNSQAAIDSHCTPCGGSTMQSWWPCNENICQCASRRNLLV